MDACPPVIIGQFLSRPHWCCVGFPYSNKSKILNLVDVVYIRLYCLILVVCLFFLSTFVSGFCPQTLLGLCPWTPLGDFHPKTPWFVPLSKFLAMPLIGATLVHALVVSHVDYCKAVLSGAPKVTTDKLQRVLNAAAQVVSGTNEFDHGFSQLPETELHLLDVPERVAYKLSVMMYRIQLHARPGSTVPDGFLPSDLQRRITATTSICQPTTPSCFSARRAFSMVGPSVSNSLPDYLCTSAVGRDTFRQHLKTFMFASYQFIQHIEVLRLCAI